MSLFLSKLLPAFLYPLGFAILTGIAAFVLIRYRRLARVCVALSVLVIWISSMPAFARWLSLMWEAQSVTIESLPEADAVVVLGGILSPSYPATSRPDLNDAADRVFAAAELFHAGKAARIVVSGGNLPWQSSSPPEAVAIARLLDELGVPKDAIVLETTSQNTRENAVNTAAVFRSNGWRRALLVTSADHMFRAAASFAHVGISVTPAPVDAHGRYPLFGGVFDILPDVRALAQTTSVMKEIVGVAYYRARGWL